MSGHPFLLGVNSPLENYFSSVYFLFNLVSVNWRCYELLDPLDLAVNIATAGPSYIFQISLIIFDIQLLCNNCKSNIIKLIYPNDVQLIINITFISNINKLYSIH